MNFGHLSEKKKGYLTENELKKSENDAEFAKNSGDRWGFTNVLPRSGYIQSVHLGKRTQEEAEFFVQKIKRRSNGKAHLILSDAWFYEEPISEVYSTYEAVLYSGRGRPRKPIRVVDKNLKYAQVYKKRDSKGKIIEWQNRIIIGQEAEILEIIRQTSRGATQINTSYVEGKNCVYRKDNARLTRKTLCHSKKAENHDGQIYFLTGVFNFCRENIGLREEINPNASLFEQKYKKKSSAMVEGVTDKILTIKELLAWRPRKNSP